MEAFCPTSAPLGHGGTVTDADSLPVPRLDVRRRGVNTDTPTPRHQIWTGPDQAYTVAERKYGLITLVPPHDEAPTLGGRGGRRDHQRRVQRPEAAPNVVNAAKPGEAENAVDRPIPPRAQQGRAPTIEQYRIRGPRAVMKSRPDVPTPRGVVDGR